MPHKTSIYLDEVTERILAARDPELSTHRRHGRRSQLLREFARRYDEICQNDLPELHDDDWEVILEAGKGWTTDENPAPASVLVGTVLDACRRAPGGAALVKKLLNLTAGERIAIVDFVERYWAAKAKNEALPSPSRTDAKRERKAAHP
jgi:hypothetical protein